MGILQARILEWVAVPSSRGLPDPRIEPESVVSPALAGRFFTTEPPEKPCKWLDVKIFPWKPVHRPVTTSAA